MKQQHHQHHRIAILALALLLPLPAYPADYIQNDTTLALPRADNENWTLTIGPTLQKLKLKGTAHVRNGDAPGDPTYNFPVTHNETTHGATLALGWRLTRHHSLQLDLGIHTGTTDETYSADDYNHDGNPDDSIYQKLTTRDLHVPLFLTYNLRFPFGARDRFEVNIAPAAGLSLTRHTLRADAGQVLDTDRQTKLRATPAYGIGAGLTWHINEKIYVEFTYRWTQTAKSKTTFRSLQTERDLKTTTHALTLSLGLKHWGL
jgi:opacity protein-like surface antigen